MAFFQVPQEMFADSGLPWGWGGCTPWLHYKRGSKMKKPRGLTETCVIFGGGVSCLSCCVDNPCWLLSFSAQTRKPHLLPVLAPRTHWSWHYWPPSGALASQAPFPWGEAGLEVACRAQHSLPAEQLAPSPPTTCSTGLLSSQRNWIFLSEMKNREAQFKYVYEDLY